MKLFLASMLILCTASTIFAESANRVENAFLACGRQDFTTLPYPFAGLRLDQSDGKIKLSLSSLQSSRTTQLLSKLGGFTAQFVPVLVETETPTLACFQKGNLLRCHGNPGTFTTKSRSAGHEFNLPLKQLTIITEQRKMDSVDGVRFEGLVATIQMTVEKDNADVVLSEEFIYPAQFANSFAKCTTAR